MTLTDHMLDHIAEIARRRGLKLVMLFGSVAAGSDRPDSDVDIAVRFGAADMPFSRVLDIQRDLSSLLDGRKVDLSVIDHADPLFMKKIAEACVILYEEPGEGRRFMLLSFKRYQDYKKYLAIERAYALDYVKRIAS